ncbi:hypothetical protein ACQ4PT_059784 [Festuca glaucescens]
MAEPTTIVGCYVFQFRVDYEQNKKLPIGEAVHSDVVSVGGHLWRVECFPRGYDEADNGEYVSIFFNHMSKSRRVRAIVEAFMMDRDGEPSTSDIRRICETFAISGDEGFNDSWGWSQFEEVTDVEKYFLIERHVTFHTISILRKEPGSLILQIPVMCWAQLLPSTDSDK